MSGSTSTKASVHSVRHRSHSSPWMMPTSESTSNGLPAEIEHPRRANAWRFHSGPTSTVRLSASVNAVESPSKSTVVGSGGIVSAAAGGSVDAVPGGIDGPGRGRGASRGVVVVVLGRTTSATTRDRPSGGTRTSAASRTVTTEIAVHPPRRRAGRSDDPRIGRSMIRKLSSANASASATCSAASADGGRSRPIGAPTKTITGQCHR